MKDSIRYSRLKQLIEDGKADRFYGWPMWHRVRDQVLRYDHYECQVCKNKGRYRGAKIVHHVKHLKDRPDLALSLYDPETGERQLISVCKQCHEDLHPEAVMHYKGEARELLTDERWD